MVVSKHDALRNRVEAYFNERFRQHGSTALGVDWNGVDSQALRFAALDQVWRRDEISSLLDFGCGYGAYLRHLREHGFSGSYTGIDLSEPMIEWASTHFEDDDLAIFKVGSRPTRSDYCVASGVFNLIPSAHDQVSWREYVADTVAELCLSVNKGLAINFILPTTVPYSNRPELFAPDPESMKMTFERLGMSTQILRDYGLHDYTLIGRIEDSASTKA